MVHKKRNLFLLAFGIIIALLILFFVIPFRISPSQPSSENHTTSIKNTQCQTLTRYTWQVNVSAKMIQRLNKADRPDQYCEPWPESGLENMRLDFVSQNKVVFTRKMHVNLKSFVDYRDENGQFHAQSEDEKILILSSSLPFLSSEQNIEVRLANLADKKIVASGKL